MIITILLQSCSGLLLCHTVHNPFTFDENYYIFNPTTHQFVTLPRPLSGDVIGMTLAFDPWKSPNYKVISLQISKLEPEVQDHEDDDYRIVYFGESYGHLHLIQVNRQNLALYNIYEMKHDGAGWFLKYEMNVEDVVLAFPHMIRDFLETTEFHYYGMAVLDVVRGDKEDDSFLILHITEMVILRYNLVDKSFYKLWVLTMVFMMHLLGVCILIDQTLTSTLNLPIVGKFTSTLQRYRCLLLQLGGILTACLDGR